MLTDWRSFRFELRFDRDRLRDEIVNIEAYRLSLSKLILPQHWREDLQKLHIVRSVHGTTAIEGNPLTEDEVSKQLHEHRQRARMDQLHRQTRNAASAFRWVEQQFQRPRPIRLSDILTIHELLTKDSDEGDNIPGRLRDSGHNVTVGSPQLGGVHHAPPGGTTTAQLLDEFIEFINSASFKAENVVVQALAAHFYFVTLHPFGNGNGRATRCIEAAILYAGGYNTYGFYSLSNYFYRNRDAYFRTLQETRTPHSYDLTAFLQFGLSGFRAELDRINAYVRHRTHRLQYRDLIRRCTERRVGPKRRLLNEREAALLHRLLELGKPADPFSDAAVREVTLRGDLSAIIGSLYAHRTDRTMVRELTRLRELGFIKFEPAATTGDWRALIDFEAIARY